MNRKALPEEIRLRNRTHLPALLAVLVPSPGLGKTNRATSGVEVIRSVLLGAKRGFSESEGPHAPRARLAFRDAGLTGLYAAEAK